MYSFELTDIRTYSEKHTLLLLVNSYHIVVIGLLLHGGERVLCVHLLCLCVWVCMCVYVCLYVYLYVCLYVIFLLPPIVVKKKEGKRERERGPMQLWPLTFFIVVIIQ